MYSASEFRRLRILETNLHELNHTQKTWIQNREKGKTKKIKGKPTAEYQRNLILRNLNIAPNVARCRSLPSLANSLRRIKTNEQPSQSHQQNTTLHHTEPSRTLNNHHYKKIKKNKKKQTSHNDYKNLVRETYKSRDSLFTSISQGPHSENQCERLRLYKIHLPGINLNPHPRTPENPPKLHKTLARTTAMQSECVSSWNTRNSKRNSPNIRQAIRTYQRAVTESECGVSCTTSGSSHSKTTESGSILDVLHNQSHRNHSEGCRSCSTTNIHLRHEAD